MMVVLGGHFVLPVLLLCVWIPLLSAGVKEDDLKAAVLRSQNRGIPPTRPSFRPPPLRLRIAVEGVIYCKHCKLPGYDKLLDASPLPGAVAELQCNSSKHGLQLNRTANADGYFLIPAPAAKVSTFGSHKCRVHLVSSPMASCGQATNLGGRVTGAMLRFERVLNVGPEQWALFSAGFFEFAPANGTTMTCPH